MSTSIDVNVQTLNRLRARLVVTWSELATKAGISPATRSKLRSGRPVSVRVIRRVAKALDVEPSELVQAEPETAEPAAVVGAA